MLLQQIAQNVEPEKLRIVSYHPGLIKTDTTKDLEKYFPGGVPWDTRKYSHQFYVPAIFILTLASAELAGDFAVWLTSPDAAFLHGRFVQAAWDVDELRSGKMREKIDNDPYLLKVGILGFHP